jgi:hypothetical protein
MPHWNRAIAVRSIRQGRIAVSIAAGVLIAAVPGGGAAREPRPQTPDHDVDQAVRAFMQSVAHDVTQDGPLAWIKYFDAGPRFFMAVNGALVFPNVAAAQEGTRKFARTISHIELNWGDDLRVDALSADLAVVAASWHETQVDTAGHRVDETGYFTGLAEHRKGGWQFRNAHWSSPAALPLAGAEGELQIRATGAL